eukprot:jgi/Tetstr1/465623/TSEL_010269.t1
MREANGLLPLPKQHDIGPPCARRGCNGDPPGRGAQADVDSGYELDSDTTNENHEESTGGPPATPDLTLDQLLPKIEALVGRRQIDARGVTTAKTLNETVLDISVIKSRLPAVKEKFGAASAEYIPALLQTNLWSLRAELGTVKVINRESQARAYPN